MVAFLGSPVISACAETYQGRSLDARQEGPKAFRTDQGRLPKVVPRLELGHLDRGLRRLVPHADGHAAPHAEVHGVAVLALGHDDLVGHRDAVLQPLHEVDDC